MPDGKLPALGNVKDRYLEEQVQYLQFTDRLITTLRNNYKLPSHILIYFILIKKSFFLKEKLLVFGF